MKGKRGALAANFCGGAEQWEQTAEVVELPLTDCCSFG
jgi:hypothetical protein